MTHRVLVADDEPLYLRTTGDLLRKQGYDCVCVPDADQAMQRLREEHFDLVLSDLNMPGNLKLELLYDHNRLRKHVPIIVITGVPSLPTAIESIRLGIADYLLKPVKFDDLLLSVRRAIKNAAQSNAAAASPMRDPCELQTMFPEIIGSSPPMLELFEIIDRIARTDCNVLITGESGTGKEVVAKALHRHSHRAEGVFQVIDCTAVPELLFESMLFGHMKGSFTGAVSDQPGLLKQCDGGTAFFDELGELSLPMQAKLLRAVQEQTFTPVGSHTPVMVNTRFVCATNRDLQIEVDAGRFRQDLFYRLGVIHIELPPLRDRDEDLVLLAHHFLETLTKGSSQSYRLSEKTIEYLQRYRWPGNIRELRNVMERTIALCRGNLIEPNDLPEQIRSAELLSSCQSQLGMAAQFGPANGNHEVDNLMPKFQDASRDDAIRVAEYQYLVGLMRKYVGNVSEAARQARLSRQGLHRLLRQHEIQASEFRS